MKLLTTIQELFQHMDWADALVWQTVAASDAALEDEDLRARLLHIHTVQRAFLRIRQERPLNPNVCNDLGYCWRMCAGNAQERDAVLEMEEGPPKPVCRSRLQTTISCVGQEPSWRPLWKRRDSIVSCVDLVGFRSEE